MPDQHPASNTNAKKRLAEHIAELDAAAKSFASVTATEPPLSQPHGPEAHSDPTGALGGSQGVEAIRVMLTKWSGCWCETQMSHDHDPRVQDCPQHGDDSCRHMAEGITVDLAALLAPAPASETARVFDCGTCGADSPVQCLSPGNCTPAPTTPTTVQADRDAGQRAPDLLAALAASIDKARTDRSSTTKES